MADEALTAGLGPGQFQLLLQSNLAANELRQMPLGIAGVNNLGAKSSGQYQTLLTGQGQLNILKNTAVALLAGGRVYWDYSANECTYKKVSDRDFYIGRAARDEATTNPSALVQLNVDPAYDLDLLRDPYITAPVGTQALGGFLPPQFNGGLTFKLTATSEAQKVDALSKDGFAAAGAKAIVEGCINVISYGTGGSQDLSVGIASATHATDADAIAQHLLLHMNGNDDGIYFQSKDGSTTVTAADSTVNATAGAGIANRIEFWMDLRTPSSVKLYVNGVQVLSGSTFDISAAAATWYLLAHLEKTSSTDAFNIDLEWLRARLSDQ